MFPAVRPYVATLVLVVGLLSAGRTVHAAPDPGSDVHFGSKATKEGPTAPPPYDASAVAQTFLPTPTGGIQRVTANESGDARQIGLIRGALQRLAENFGSDDYSRASPLLKHDAPGLATLVAARPGELKAVYVEIRGGAEVRYTATDPKILAALHEWFASQ